VKAGTARKQKQIFKSFLQETVGITSDFQKKVSILDIPEKLFVTKIGNESNSNWTDTAADFDITSLFKKE